MVRLSQKEDGKRNGTIQACWTSLLKDPHCHRQCRRGRDGDKVFNSWTNLRLTTKCSNPKRKKARNAANWERIKAKYPAWIANGIQQPKGNGNTARGRSRGRCLAFRP
jgi:hypothetical protein